MRTSSLRNEPLLPNIDYAIAVIKGGIQVLIRKRLLIVAILIIVVLFSFYLLIDLRLKASILELAKAKAQLKVVELINQAVYEKVVSETDYKDIVYVHKDDEGRIVMIQANTIILNQIMAKTSNAIIDSFNDEEEYVKIPLGQISGITFLSGSGPKIGVKIILCRQLNVSVEDKFEQAGINQTRHKIYLQINSPIRIAVPLMGKEFNVVTTIPMAETIIVGEVPNTYVNFNESADKLLPISQSIK